MTTPATSTGTTTRPPEYSSEIMSLKRNGMPAMRTRPPLPKSLSAEFATLEKNSSRSGLLILTDADSAQDIVKTLLGALSTVTNFAEAA